MSPRKYEVSEVVLQNLYELSRMAQPHIENSAGKLDTLPIDPDTHPAQTSAVINGTPQSQEIVNNVATLAEPQFPLLTEQLDEPKNKQALDEVAELLKSGQNVVTATNHGELIDIAIAQAAIYSKLKDRDVDFRSGIFISKMVSLLAYRIGPEKVPATEALKMLCDEVYLSYPRTKSLDQSDITKRSSEEVANHNRYIRAAVIESLGRGGLMLAIAPSGTTDKLVDQSAVKLGRVGRATADLLQTDKTYILPTAVWLKDSQPTISIEESPVKARTENEVHDLMGVIAAGLNQKLPGRRFEYAHPN